MLPRSSTYKTEHPISAQVHVAPRPLETSRKIADGPRQMLFILNIDFSAQEHAENLGARSISPREHEG